MIRQIAAWSAVAAGVVALLGAASVAALAEEAGAPACTPNAPQQGGILLCRAAPGAEILLDGDVVSQADADGWVVIGLPHKAPEAVRVAARDADGAVAEHVYAVAEREYQVQRIDGLPPSKVSTFTDEQLAHIRRSTAIKRAAFTDIQAGQGFLDGFIIPTEGPITSVYGSQRILNGEPKRPHFGIDVAGPTGTPIVAPAGGVVTLADDDLYFEGGTVFLDHGQGLVSVFMHMSRIDVTPGQDIAQGEMVGAVGSTGRSTGPHLHWGIKWRDKYYVDPDAALGLVVPTAADAG